MEPTSELVRWRPAGPLRPYIAWYSGYQEAGVAPRLHRGLPSPYLTLIVSLHEPLVMAAHADQRIPPGRYDTLLGGLHTRPALITHDGRQSGIQVNLSPLGARALLGLPAGELAGADFDAADVVGPFAAELRERVLEATGWAGRFTVLDRMLLARLGAASAPDEVERAWHRVLASAGAVPVADLAREVGWSERYLSRRFSVEIGLSPKTAARVTRFDRARRALLDAPDGTALAAIAADHGYYDQAHFARDFGEFAGCTATRWLAEEFRNVQDPGAAPPSDSAP
ncbi:AraC family transcriptional regulator [Planotetraspora thailandica]|uniref:AraC family transcriptional regulator n=1 Tax=Planotetraspora thailandica TaxID=487172 RepID=A0A8J3VAA7_9ACTN|nr:helix-turn-helix domain-containing protein [Planotetraspora thailandica]GII57074.1 AraC family transcriptional regulator [Planotetraspora thailandica]